MKMAGTLNVISGTKMNVAFDVPIGESPDFNMMCTFKQNEDETYFLVSIPLKGGKPVEIGENQKLLFRYAESSEQLIVAGFVDDIVKVGIRRFWKIHRVDLERQYFVRKDVRIKVGLHVQYMQDNWKPNFDGIIEKDNGLTLDISLGGLALYVNRRFNVGETLFVTMPNIGMEEAGHLEDDLVGVVCWQRDTPKGSAYRNIIGIQFRTNSDSEKEVLQNYIGCVQKRYKV